MQLTTDQTTALLRLIADLTEQRDAARADYQQLNSEWDERERRAAEERASQPNHEEIALLEVLRAWMPLPWRWHHLRNGEVAYAETEQGEWQVKWCARETWEAALLFAPKGARGVAEVDRKVSGATRLAALVGIVARGQPGETEVAR